MMRNLIASLFDATFMTTLSQAFSILQLKVSLIKQPQQRQEVFYFLNLKIVV